MRVVVDATRFDEADTVQLVIRDGEKVAEIQVAAIGDSLNVIVAGDVASDRDPRNNLRLRVYPQ